MRERGDEPMEDLDDKPSKFHALNNQLQAIFGGIGVIKEQVKNGAEQSARIEHGISSLDVRLGSLDRRMGDIEKGAIADKARLESQIHQVKSDLERQVWEVTTSLKTSMESLSPVRLIVYGAVVMIITAVFNLWVTRATMNDALQDAAAQSQQGVTK